MANCSLRHLRNDGRGFGHANRHCSSRSDCGDGQRSMHPHRRGPQLNGPTGPWGQCHWPSCYTGTTGMSLLFFFKVDWITIVMLVFNVVDCPTEKCLHDCIWCHLLHLRSLCHRAVPWCERAKRYVWVTSPSPNLFLFEFVKLPGVRIPLRFPIAIGFDCRCTRCVSTGLTLL